MNNIKTNKKKLPYDCIKDKRLGSGDSLVVRAADS